MHHPYLLVACLAFLIIGVLLIVANILARLIAYWIFFN